MSCTPGTWLIADSAMALDEGSTHAFEIFQDAEPDSAVIDRHTICYLPFDAKNRTEQRDNALLIAAAPDLLAALKAIKDTCPADPDTTHRFLAAWHLLEAAIAIAEGRQDDDPVRGRIGSAERMSTR